MTRPEPQHRPTARQLAAQSQGSDPWACRMCGCRATEVVDSRQHGTGPRKRVRRCLHCKEPMSTQEIPVPDGFKIAVVPDEEEEEVAA